MYVASLENKTCLESCINLSPDWAEDGEREFGPNYKYKERTT